MTEFYDSMIMNIKFLIEKKMSIHPYAHVQGKACPLLPVENSVKTQILTVSANLSVF